MSRYRQSLLTGADATPESPLQHWDARLPVRLLGRGQVLRRDEHTRLLGQYFGWVEIFRREAGLALGGDKSGDYLLALLDRVSDTFATNAHSPLLRIFRPRQSAIAELMISDESRGTSRIDCLGYATFVRRLREDDFKQWFAQVSSDLETMAGNRQAFDASREGRIRPLQHALVDLIEFLEAGRKTQLRHARASGSDTHASLRVRPTAGPPGTRARLGPRSPGRPRRGRRCRRTRRARGRRTAGRRRCRR